MSAVLRPTSPPEHFAAHDSSREAMPDPPKVQIQAIVLAGIRMALAEMMCFRRSFTLVHALEGHAAGHRAFAKGSSIIV